MSAENFEAVTFDTQLTFEHAAFSDEEKAELGITGKNGAYTGLALLLSDQCEHESVVTVYTDDERTEVIEQQVFKGSLPAQIDGIMRMLARDDARKVKETLVAAFVHRDYTYAGELMVNVFPDRIEIMGMGALKEVDRLRRWRNEKLLAALRRLRHNATKPKEFVGTRGAFMFVYRSDTPPEQKLIEFLKDHGSIRRKEAEIVLGLKQTAAGKVLKELTERGLTYTVGGGKNIKYMLKESEK